MSLTTCVSSELVSSIPLPPDMPVAAPFTQTPLQQQIELECTLQWPHIRSHHMRPSRVQTHFEFEGVEHCVVDLHLSDDAHVPSTAEEHT